MNAHWPGQNPIGKHIRIGGGVTGPWTTIVGVVGATRQYGLDADPRPGLYLSYLQEAHSKMSLLIRTAGDPLSLANEIRDAVRRVDPDQPVAAVKTIDRLATHSVSSRSFQAMLLTTFGAVALLLASLGVFGLLSWSVAQRTREIGLRLALGATPTDVLWMLSLRAMTLVFAGLLIGSLGALAITRVLRRLLYEVSTTDPLNFSTVALVIFVFAALASTRPALRAVRVDPVQALRTE